MVNLYSKPKLFVALPNQSHYYIFLFSFNIWLNSCPVPITIQVSQRKQTSKSRNTGVATQYTPNAVVIAEGSPQILIAHSVFLFRKSKLAGDCTTQTP